MGDSANNPPPHEDHDLCTEEEVRLNWNLGLQGISGMHLVSFPDTSQQHGHDASILSPMTRTMSNTMSAWKVSSVIASIRISKETVERFK